MDTDHIREVAPHYVAMVVLAMLVFGVIQAIIGRELGFWAELAIISVVVFGYRPAVMALGVGPTAWKREPQER
jgi:hypothetical protein